jgi:hypothetical protein
MRQPLDFGGSGLFYASKLFRRFSGKSKKFYSGDNFSWSFDKIEFYESVLKLELRTPAGMVGRYMSGVGTELANKARAQVGKKTGALARSIGMSVSGATYGVKLSVYARDKKAFKHHEGTRPHVIYPKNPGGVLIFGKGGRVIKTKRVMHPGTKPNRFLSDQLRHIN